MAGRACGPAKWSACYADGVLDPREISPDTIRPILRVEYERMVQMGLFADEHVELLEGVIVRMSPHGPDHDDAVTRLTRRLVQALGDRAEVRPQCAFATADSEPEPDVAVVPPGPYHAAHPSQAILVIEVARSSLAKDRGPKARIYAAAGVPEYWVVNLEERQLEIHRDAREGTYTRIEILRAGQTVRLDAFPDVELDVAFVFGGA